MEKGQTHNSNPSQNRAQSGYEPKVFVSYGWVEESEHIVDELEQAFKDHGIHMVRDKKDLGYKGSIEEFEKRIGRARCVVLVISDKYLRSDHCMHELLQVSEHENLWERIFPIVLPDAQIYKARDRAQYINYWEQEIEELSKTVRTIERPVKIKSIQKEIDKYDDIRQSFDHLTATLRDMNALTPEMHVNDRFSTLINAVKEAMADQEISFQTEKPSAEEIVSPPEKPVVVKPPVPVGRGGRGCEANFKVMLMVAVGGAGILLTALMSTKLIAIFGAGPSLTPTITATLTPTQASTPIREPTPTEPMGLPPCPEESTTRYGFDCGFQLWSNSPDEKIKAVTNVTSAQVLDRRGSPTTVMVLTVDFTGDPVTREAEFRELGEAEVDLIGQVPMGYEGKTVDDLAGKTITAYVWASKGASGVPGHLNGFQLFIRDENYVSCYGDWKNIEPSSEENWFRIVWEEPTMDEKLADADQEKRRCHPDFNINKPIILGLQIAVGVGSTVQYTEPLTVYVDDVDWISTTATSGSN